eukprot:2673055-Pleurochrysis_carterae.AAC.2
MSSSEEIRARGARLWRYHFGDGAYGSCGCELGRAALSILRTCDRSAVGMRACEVFKRSARSTFAAIEGISCAVECHRH